MILSALLLIGNVDEKIILARLELLPQPRLWQAGLSEEGRIRNAVPRIRPTRPRSPEEAFKASGAIRKTLIDEPEINVTPSDYYSRIIALYGALLGASL